MKVQKRGLSGQNLAAAKESRGEKMICVGFAANACGKFC